MHQIHATAARFAITNRFRLRRDHVGRYRLVGQDGANVDCPAWGETTAAGAIRMMRRHLRLGLTSGRRGMSEILTVAQLRRLVAHVEDLPPHAEIELTEVWQEFYAERIAQLPDGITYFPLGPTCESLREAYLRDGADEVLRIKAASGEF